jgi:hypothetical protein
MSNNESDELLVDESAATLEESPGVVQQHAGDYAEPIMNTDPDDRTKEIPTELASDNVEAYGELPGLLEEGH